MRLSDLLVEKLLQFGVKGFFGVTGRGSLYLSDAIARRAELSFHPTFHEQSAGYAALAVSKATKSPSVVFLSTGVGSTNVISPVLCAWQDQIPLVLVSGQNFSHSASTLVRSSKRTYGEQEADLAPIVKSMVKAFYVVDDPSSFESTLEGVLKEAVTGRPGPVWIDIPLDFQSAKVSPHGEFFSVESGRTTKSFSSNSSDISSFERPLILVGPSFSSPNDSEELRSAVEAFGWPVAVESGAEGILSNDFPLFLGSVGQMGSSPEAMAALEIADLVVVVGGLFRSSLTGDNLDNFLPGKQILVMDENPDEIPSGLEDRAEYLGTFSAEILRQLMGLARPSTAWTDGCNFVSQNLERKIFSRNSVEAMDLYQLAEWLPEAGESDTLFVTDSGYCEVILPSNTRIQKNQSWVHPYSQGAMGFVTGAALGIALYSKAKSIVGIVGDGSLMMNLQDLQSISEAGGKVKLILIDNDMYGIIRARQTDLFRGRTVGVDSQTGLGPVDWPRLVSSFGLPFIDFAERAFELEDLASALRAPGPAVIRILGVSDQRYWIPPTRNVSDAKSRYRSEVMDVLDERYEAALAALQRACGK